MAENKTYDILCIGNYTKDTIISPAGVKYVDGGAVNYAAHACARMGLSVAVVTRLAEEDRRVVDKLVETGIDCYATYTPYSTLMKLEYPTHNPDIRTLSVAHTAGSIGAGDLENIKAKTAVIGTSLRGEVCDDVIPALRRKGTRVAADMQGYARVLVEQSLEYLPWPEMEKTLAQVDILKSDAVEAEFLTGEKDIYKAAQIYASMGPGEIVLTHKDGLLVYSGGKCYEAGFYPQVMNGRSGRGDTCLGTYAAMRLSKPPAEACIWAAAITSLKMEKLGVFTRTVQEVEDLIRQKYIQ